MAFSVKGDSVTILVDCIKQMTSRLARTVTSRVATDGLILTGVQLVEGESFFVGDLQQLLIADTPDEAYNLCTKYSPECSVSTGYSSSSSFSSSAEVSRSASASASSAEVSRSASRTSSLISGGTSSVASGSSRHESNLSREQVQTGLNVIGGRHSASGQMNRGSSHMVGEYIASGASGSESIVTQGQGGERAKLAEIREDIYGMWHFQESLKD